jgi:hypothetical protein
VLCLVSLREQSTTFSLAELYRTCTDMPTLTGDDDDGYDDNVEVVKKNKGKKNKKEVKEGRTNQTRGLTCCRIQSRIWAKRNSCRSIEPSMNACPSRPSTSM